MTALPRFRHVDYGPAPTVADIGPAGLVALLDEHGVDDWLPVLHAIAEDPWGIVARRVAQVIGHLETHGTGQLFRAWLARCRRGLEAGPTRLADMRKAQGLNQRQLADRLGVSQAQVARLENTSAPSMRSLRRYLSALGYHDLGMLASDGDGVTLVRI